MQVPENLDNLFFAENSELKGEYRRLFASLYKTPEDYMRIVEALASHKEGYTREEIADKLKLANLDGIHRLAEAFSIGSDTFFFDSSSVSMEFTIVTDEISVLFVRK